MYFPLNPLPPSLSLFLCLFRSIYLSRSLSLYTRFSFFVCFSLQPPLFLYCAGTLNTKETTTLSLLNILVEMFPNLLSGTPNCTPSPAPRLVLCLYHSYTTRNISYSVIIYSIFSNELSDNKESIQLSITYRYIKCISIIYRYIKCISIIIYRYIKSRQSR